jgi:phosphoglycerate kinase
VSLRTLDDVGEVDDRTVFVRVDFNVPLTGGRVADDMRIRAALPTVHELRERGATLILGSHLGRPKGAWVDDLSVRPVGEALSGLLEGKAAVRTLGLPDDEDTVKAARDLAPGEIALLENLRFNPGEEANDPVFAGHIAELADAYVDDAFGAVHRAHASVLALPDLMLATGRPAVAGRLLQREVEVLGRLLRDAERPYVAILGGAKVSDKLAVIDSLTERVDALLVGGAMAFTLLAAAGGRVGRSLVERDRLDDVREALERAAHRGVTIHVPIDVVAAPEVDAQVPASIVPAAGIPDDLMGLDIGPATVRAFGDVLRDAKTILWNGPMGVFELEPFAAGTNGVARACADADAFTVVGGGDSLSAVRKAGLEAAFDHLSTGGGASLEFLEGRRLPGIAILEVPRDSA